MIKWIVVTRTEAKWDIVLDFHAILENIVT